MKSIIEQFANDSEYRSLIEGFSEKRIPCVISGMCDSARPFLVSAMLKDLGKKGVVIVPEEKEANAVIEVFRLFFDKVLFYPARDFVFENITAYSREWEHERLSVQYAVAKGDYDVIVTVPDALMQYVMPIDVFEANSFFLSYGDTASQKDICIKLEQMGYTRTEVVEGVGQFSVRGGIVDIFTPNYAYPVRIDFWGDEIDLIGFFDIVSQRRTENLDNVVIIPCNELMPTDFAKSEMRKEIKGLISSFVGPEKRRQVLLSELESLEKGNKNVFADKYFSLIYPENQTLLDFTSDSVCFLFGIKRIEERAKGFASTNDSIVETLASNGLCKIKNSRPYSSAEELFSSLGKNTVSIDVFQNSGTAINACASYTFVTKSTLQMTDKTDVFIEDIEDYIAASRKVLLLCSGEHAANTMIEMLSDDGIAAYQYSGTLYASRVAVAVCDSEIVKNGFELPKSGFVLLTDYMSLRPREELKRRRRSAKTSKGEKIASYADLKQGDLVVHVNHGIGRYSGIKNLVSQGVSRDYIKIVYADNGILYVPCDQLDMVSKYIGADDTKLSKMGGAEWKRAKARAKASASNIAKELIKLYAERRSIEGYSFPPDDEFQDEFEAGFEYTETDGQFRAACEIKKDMENPYPMDRLLCGDVGFGKTEVSLRAIFKCAFAGKQAAVLVPTTILSFQHYRTMQARFRGYPVRIAMLSRFVTPKEQAEIIKGLKNGTVDIVVGTHRLLQKDIEFKDLGLLVVDEEQRFGVTHKEKLKELSKGVDVLTLTATPIPRTLNMALSGIRDMSVLEEAPTDRVPVQTFVLEHDEDVIFEAIRRELRRGGQVFYLHNYVDSIYSKAAFLRNAFPEATIAVGHGKMDKEELSDVWSDMVDGSIDILVCTTIIESGVNVPNANTLIIENADKMGLAQLHQIRGRVGRSTRKAYAYLTYRAGAVINEIAEKRLAAIREFTEFGSGFKIAMRDLEIRGAGNLLGAEQSGHLEAIGYDLYIKILEDAINAEKGIAPKAEKNCTIDLACDAFIPETYIVSLALRIDVYKKIAAVCNEDDSDDLIDELNDRFGDIPESVMNLIRISRLRNMAMEFDFTSVEQNQRMLTLYNPNIDMERCAIIASEDPFKGAVMISLGGRPHISYKLRDGEKNLDFCEKIIQRYSKLTKN
ncbi:MAG: transcription-repair coupling factor [Clostridia bacterium]|nr:transcription-repair coupling factor [Clostridia bacterium]